MAQDIMITTAETLNPLLLPARETVTLIFSDSDLAGGKVLNESEA